MAERKANGAAIRAIRKALGISQQDFAARLGIQPPTMSQVESGKYGLSDEKLRAAANELGVPLAAICLVIPDEPEPQSVAS